MEQLNVSEMQRVHGGKELSDAELSNAYMMACSMTIPGIATTMLNHSFPSVANDTLYGGITNALILGVGTGVGVYLGYQIYYAVYEQ